MSDKWPSDVVEIGERIVNLTLVQAVELSEYLEQVHGIKSAGGVPLPNPNEQQQKPSESVKVEQLEWAVILDGYEPEKKINAVKVFREVTASGLKEAMEFITTGTGKPIKEGISRAEAEALKTRLEAAGAKCSLK
jgi:large subunit ribosomal protein L7/L12